ncbi:hypothetical protein [Bacillus thuringiensis]|uniref:hypothetical protein n=1 Tax=Bacillus thuringiensis TaxID=1428 RepID=UPI003F5C3DB2
MAAIVISENLKTNIEKDSEAFTFLQDINKHYGFEKIVVTKTTFTDGGFFSKRMYSYYSIYIKISDCEYQHMMCFKSLGLQDVECYLLGYLNGLGI